MRLKSCWIFTRFYLSLACTSSFTTLITRHSRVQRQYRYIKMSDPDYAQSAERMVSRWAGVQGPARPNPTPDEEITAKQDISQIQIHEEYVLESPKKVPFLDKCQVLVVGSGPAGLSSALAAKRAGADVLLVEKFGCLGGVITTVGMESIAWYRYEGCVDCEGIGVEMERLAARMGAASKWPYNESHCLDADFFKVVADRLMEEAGVRVILHCMATEVIMDGNIIKGIITESKSGRLAILADRVIDCTGDADVAYLSGAEYRKTSKSQMMSVTTVFSCAGVDKDKFLKYTESQPATYADWSEGVWTQETTGKENGLRSPYLHDAEFEEARAKGLIPEHINTLGGTWSALSDAGEATSLNLVHIEDVDSTDVRDLTKAEIQGRKQTMHALQALKHVIPGFEKAKLRNFGMTVGCRDSRKIIGRYNLTGSDVRNAARFPDSIGIFPEFLDGYNLLILPTTGRYFQVPFGCTVPKNVDNLLVAGRCVAGDKTSHCAMRNMMACTVTGQGAGAAAAVSLREGVCTSDVDVQIVQKELRKQGVRIE